VATAHDGYVIYFHLVHIDTRIRRLFHTMSVNGSPTARNGGEQAISRPEALRRHMAGMHTE
jgi:hypothetical protein